MKPWQYIALLLVLTAACGSSGAPPPQPTAVRAALPGSAAVADQPPVDATPESGPQTVLVGALPTIGDVATLIADRRGYFAEVGIACELISMPSVTQVIPALSTGQVDVGTGLGVSASLVNAVQRGLPLKVVAAISTATSERWGSGFAVSGQRGRPVQSLKDFPAPVRIGIAGEASLSHAMANLLAKRDGVPISELELVSLGFPDMNVALATDRIDVASGVEPFVTIGEQNGTVKRWHSYAELLPGVPLGTVVYGERFLSQDRELGQRFLRAWLRGARDYDDGITSGRDIEEIGAILADRVPRETFALLRRSGTVLWIPPDGKVDPTSLAELIAVWRNDGLVTDLPASSLLDPTFAEHAVGWLGPYQPH